MYVNIQSELVPSLRAYGPKRRENENYKILVGSIPTMARHIFQACPVWIYTQSNITSIILFILFYKIRRTKQILNLFKYLRVHWLGLTTEINSNNGAPTKKTNYYTCTKTLIGFRQTVNNMIWKINFE
jgi:hypothetical protein